LYRARGAGPSIERRLALFLGKSGQLEIPISNQTAEKGSCGKVCEQDFSRQRVGCHVVCLGLPDFSSGPRDPNFGRVQFFA